MAEWIHIDEQQPQQGQPVYYWFGVWDQVYAGCFEVSEDEDCKGMRIFYGDSGFLGDDVTWWQPREELPEGITFSPDPPTDEQKSRCKYHPIIEGDVMTLPEITSEEECSRLTEELCSLMELRFEPGTNKADRLVALATVIEAYEKKRHRELRVCQERGYAMIKAPWTAEQIKNLADYQNCGIVHPYTCGECSGPKADLVPTAEGWYCPYCNKVVQDWAHDADATEFTAWWEEFKRKTQAEE